MADEVKRKAARRSGISIRMIAYIGIVWSAVVAAVLIWQAIVYGGLFAALAEWQFRQFDRMFPVATIAMLVLVFALPFLLVVIWRLRGRRRRHGEPDAQALLERDALVTKTLKLLAIGFAVLALLVAAIGFSIRPAAERAAQVITFAGGETLAEGRIVGRGLLLTNRIGYYREHFVVAGRDLYVAPLVSAPDSRELRYFVEVSPQPASEATRQEVAGILRIRALPGGLRQLYENAGYEVKQPVYMIFATSRSASWPYFSAAADLALLALLLGLCWLAMRRHVRQLRERNGTS